MAMNNSFRCELCGVESDDRPIIIRFSYTLLNGTPGVELIYLCRGCDTTIPKQNPVRRSQLIQLFMSLYPNRQLKPES
jgi:hypothetical protein